MTIAFLGTGLMGTGFVKRMRTQGLSVRVWNRSTDKAQALAAVGAQPCSSAADAVKGVERVHLMLSDDEAVDAVLASISTALDPQTWIIDHTTTAPTPTAARAARMKSLGLRYVHAPVFMGPANAEAATGVMLLCGEAQYRSAVTPILQQMTTKVVDLGDAPDRAAAFKLFGNLAIIGLMGVLGDVARLANAVGMSAAEAMSLFEHFNPGATLPTRAAKVADGPYRPPSFEVSMARKDVRLMIEEAQRHGVSLAVMPAIMSLFDAAVARGESALDSSAAMRFPIKPVAGG